MITNLRKRLEEQRKPKSQTDAAQTRGLRRKAAGGGQGGGGGGGIDDSIGGRGFPPQKPGRALRDRLPEVGGNRQEGTVVRTATETKKLSPDDSTQRRIDLEAGDRRSLRTANRAMATRGTARENFFDTSDEAVTQFQRRQDLESARDRHALEREAFGRSRGLGRSETALRRSLRSPDRFTNVLRENAMTEEERQAEANLIAGAAQSDAEALRAARGLRQKGDTANQELAYKERDSVRDFQADMAGTQADLDIAGARAQQERQKGAFNRSLSVAQSMVDPEVAEQPGFEGQLRTFMSETNKDQLNERAPLNLKDEDMGALFGIASRLPELDAGIFSATPGQPVSAEPVIELIRRAAMNPGASEIQLGRDKIAVSDLEGFAGGVFNQFVERARSGFESQVAENVLSGNDLNEDQQKFVEGELEQFKEQQKASLGTGQSTETSRVGGIARQGQRGPAPNRETNIVSPDMIPQLQQMGIEVEEGEQLSSIRKKIDNLTPEDFAPMLARRAFARRNS